MDVVAIKAAAFTIEIDAIDAAATAGPEGYISCGFGARWTGHDGSESVCPYS